MSQNNTEHDDQANDLRKLINEVQSNQSEKEEITVNFEKEAHVNSEEMLNQQSNPSRTVDILNLPPRKEVHSNQNQSTRLKVSRPFLRFSTVVITLIITMLAVYYIWGEDLIELPARF